MRDGEMYLHSIRSWHISSQRANRSAMSWLAIARCGLSGLHQVA
jgi:hypothetical protein